MRSGRRRDEQTWAPGAAHQRREIWMGSPPSESRPPRGGGLFFCVGVASAAAISTYLPRSPACNPFLYVLGTHRSSSPYSMPSLQASLAQLASDLIILARALLRPVQRDALAGEAAVAASPRAARQVARCYALEHGHALLEPAEFGRGPQRTRAVEIEAEAARLLARLGRRASRKCLTRPGLVMSFGWYWWGFRLKL